MKLRGIVTGSIFWCLFTLYAQIPEGYYSGTEGLFKTELKAKLHAIIKDHQEFFYTSRNTTDTWDILKVSDRDPNNYDKVITIYGGYSVDADNDPFRWNREHVWAKSRGDFGTDIGPGSDVHNLKPADETLNSDRGNKSFDDGGWLNKDYSPPPGYASPYDAGNYTDDDSWEPRDAVKGDVARIIFYMTVRYEGGSWEPDLEMFDGVSTISDKSPTHGKMSTLLRWHQEDPPDDFERNRNDVIYRYQKNRNPFIDHPEFVDYIWSENASGQNSDYLTDKVFYSKGQVVCFNHETTPKRLEIYNVLGAKLQQYKMTYAGYTYIPAGNLPPIILVRFGSTVYKVINR